MWFESTGYMIYDPPRPGLKTKNKWWAVVRVDDEIARYYRYWIQKNPVHYGMPRIKLAQPSWNAHISVIRGEQPRPDLMHLWKKYDGKKFSFRYSGIPVMTEERHDGRHWIVEVDCPELLEIRRELHRPSNWPLHITVGRLWIHE
jgi:hypothetical protein